MLACLGITGRFSGSFAKSSGVMFSHLSGKYGDLTDFASCAILCRVVTC